jgi:thioesterase domain-containing protein
MGEPGIGKLTTGELLERLRALDVRVWAEDGKLRVNAPSGALSAELRSALQERKAELLAFFAQAAALDEQARAVVPLQPRGTRMPIFGVPGHNGDVFAYRALARELGAEQPFFGLQPPGLDGQSEPETELPRLAAYLAAQLRKAHKTGPCVVTGFCAGGTVAFELARQLRAAGTDVRLTVLFGSPFPTSYHLLPELSARIQHIGRVAARHAIAAVARPPTQVLTYLRDVAEQRRAAAEAAYADVTDEAVLAMRKRCEEATLQAVREYTPQPYEGAVCLVLPNEGWRNSTDVPMRWKPLVARYSELVGPASCNGDNMLRDPEVGRITQLLRTQLEQPE